eukprot:6775667-Alexandrium_andersonii.AAC.1
MRAMPSMSACARSTWPLEPLLWMGVYCRLVPCSRCCLMVLKRCCMEGSWSPCRATRVWPVTSMNFAK